MSGPQAPDTEAIFNSIKGLLQALALKGGITPAYNTVVIGASDDYTQLPLPCANVMLSDDGSERFNFGGTIKEAQGFLIRSVFDYTDKQAAEIQRANVRDVLMPKLQEYAVLPNTTTVYHSAIKPNSAKPGWVFLKPNWYLGHEVVLLVAQYYIIQGGIQ